jgi:type I restriction enzyme S subunit
VKKGWNSAAVDEICNVEYGTRVVRRNDAGTKHPVYGGGGETFHVDYYNREDRVVVARFGLSERCTRRVDGRFFLNDSGLTLSPRNPAALTQDFLDLWTLNSNDKIYGLSRGTAQRNLDVDAFRRMDVCFPAETSEQRRIVAILDEVIEGISAAKANAKRNLQNTKDCFESHLAMLFTERGDHWPESTLSDVCREITVGHVGSMKGEYKDTGIPFLRSQNIRPFEVTLENVVYVSQRFHQSLKKSILRPGDLAIVRTGYPGTTAVVPESLPEANCSDLVIMRVGGSVDPNYIAAFLNSSYGRYLVGSQLVGAAQKHFNVAAAKQVVLRIPPLHEQAKIVNQVMQMREQVRACEAILARKHAALDELQASLLHQAFSGAL